uniref:Protein kinase domain-containing protein n=1 Tax=Astatotilapia calliptera TaxID=8154 RepID=A0A3P8QTL2_ASTCA
MSVERPQNPVVFQHPSNLESKRSQKINCSFQNSVEFSLQVCDHTSASSSFNSGELEIVEGSILGNRYKVEAFLGEGGFGIVAKCRDTKTNRAVAIKVNRNRPDTLQQAKLEICILEQLRRLDPDAANIGLPISEVRPILHQLTNALSHLGSVGIVHADLKPGNIMVVNRHESPVKVRLIDFDLACPVSAVNPSDCVGTVGYTVELGTGVPLYPGNGEYDVLKFIIETQGQPLDHVLDSGVYTEDYFIEDNYNQQRPENGQRLFVSLIKGMLALDAHQRITPSEVLRHPFFNPGLSKRFPCIDIERPYRINLQHGLLHLGQK